MKFFLRHKLVIIYGCSLGLLLLFMKWLELQFLIINHSMELYAGSLAVIFTGLGIWLAVRLMRPKTVIVEKEVYRSAEHFVLNEKALTDTEISQRELEVLELMSQGLSNAEIADRLYVSLNTIKTHSANLFFKLDVKRRTQAVEKGKRIGIIP